MIECEHVEDSVALGEHYDRSVREADFELSITPQDESC